MASPRLNNLSALFVSLSALLLSCSSTSTLLRREWQANSAVVIEGELHFVDCPSQGLGTKLGVFDVTKVVKGTFPRRRVRFTPLVGKPTLHSPFDRDRKRTRFAYYLSPSKTTWARLHNTSIIDCHIGFDVGDVVALVDLDQTEDEWEQQKEKVRQHEESQEHGTRLGDAEEEHDRTAVIEFDGPWALETLYDAQSQQLCGPDTERCPRIAALARGRYRLLVGLRSERGPVLWGIDVDLLPNRRYEVLHTAKENDFSHGPWITEVAVFDVDASAIVAAGVPSVELSPLPPRAPIMRDPKAPRVPPGFGPSERGEPLPTSWDLYGR